jgi:hypothetical protein
LWEREQVGAAKEVILTFIDEWNVGHAKGEKIRALDIRFTPGKLLAPAFWLGGTKGAMTASLSRSSK